MPLTTFVQSQIDRIRSFLADPDAVVLELRCASEQQALLGKLLVGLAQEGEHLWAATDACWTDAEQWSQLLAESIDAAVQDAAKEFAAAGVAFEPPAPMEATDARPLRAPEHRVVEYAERVALALVPFMLGVAIAIRVPEDPAIALPLAGSLGRLVEACEGGRVHVVVLTTPEQALCKDIPVPRPRLTTWATGDTCDLRDLRRVALETTPRVLAYDAPQRGQAWMAPALIEAGLGNGSCIVRVEGVRFWRPIHFYGHASTIAVQTCVAVARQLGRDAIAARVLAEFAAPIGREDAEIVFAQLLDRLQRELLPPETGLLVVLAPSLDTSVPAPELAAEMTAFAASITELTRALVSPRTSVYAVAPGLSVTARPRDRPAIRVQTMRIDAPLIEDGLVKKLAEPDLPQVVRLRCLGALASLRMGNGDPEAAIDLNMQALELAHASEEPIEIAAAWYGMANSLYRCGALDKASEAYASCTDIAVAQDHPTLAAHGVTGMGHCEFVVGHCDRAIEYYTIGAKYHRNMGNAIAEAYVQMWIAEAHAKAGRKPDAIVTFDAALALCDGCHETMKDAADAMRADILQRKARVYGSVGLGAERRHSTDLARALGATAPPSEEP